MSFLFYAANGVINFVPTVNFQGIGYSPYVISSHLRREIPTEMPIRRDASKDIGMTIPGNVWCLTEKFTGGFRFIEEYLMPVLFVSVPGRP